MFYAMPPHNRQTTVEFNQGYKASIDGLERATNIYRKSVTGPMYDKVAEARWDRGWLAGERIKRNRRCSVR